ncbi:hypothetical protein AAEP93_002628 [Penicillium crustosum]
MSRLRVTPDYVKKLETQVKDLSSRIEAYEATGAKTVEGKPTRATSGISTLDHGPTQHPEINHDDYPMQSSTSPWESGQQELSGVNSHTRDVEFYGSSSSVALLSQIQRTGDESEGGDASSLLSTLHNPAFGRAKFQTVRESCREIDYPDSSNWFPQCRGFLEAFFTTIHYVHPILNKQTFLQRCEVLWSGSEADGPQLSSFTALYFSVLSLGALVGTRDDEPIDGINNLQWSRKFFEKAKACCNQIGMVTDLDMTQCYFMLAKVCQNELRPHLSYMYVGLAIRTALAMGINREPGTNVKKSADLRKAESRTWWGLYSLETEISFAMGRPDTLGADTYHNRRFPITDSREAVDNSGTCEMLEHPSCSIIKCMVDFSRITKDICQNIYLSGVTVLRTVHLAYQIESNLEQWIETLPEEIRPTELSGGLPSLSKARDQQWMKRQRLVLSLRYHNLRILLFGSFLLRSTPQDRASIPGSQEGVQKCLDSAKQTIDLIYQTYQHSDFFRTWFYNVTYTVFAASTILIYLAQETIPTETQPLLRLIDMAVEILLIMDECAYALEAAKLLRRAKEKAEARAMATDAAVMEPLFSGRDGIGHLNHYWGPLNLFDGDIDPNLAFSFLGFDGANPTI